MKKLSYVILCVMLLILSGCAAFDTNNQITSVQLNQIQPGMSMQNVRAILGEPFDSHTIQQDREAGRPLIPNNKWHPIPIEDPTEIRWVYSYKGKDYPFLSYYVNILFRQGKVVKYQVNISSM